MEIICFVRSTSSCQYYTRKYRREVLYQNVLFNLGADFTLEKWGLLGIIQYGRRGGGDELE
jgi:hypothetical protein